MGIEILYIALGFALGGILKGATGAGAPIVAIPVIALFFNVPLAVAVFVVPNLVSNAIQIWSYRAHFLSPSFLVRFSGAGVIGAGIGTVTLANISGDTLKLAVALAVLIFISFRLMRPEWKLPFSTAQKIAVPVGFLAGILQGASGISAPVSITFLNAIRLERPLFITTISVFFISMLVVQVPLLAGYGYLTFETLLMGILATGVLLAFMPIGGFLSKLFSQKVFDRAILVLLAALSVSLFVDVVL